jgi:hypothetical protein
MTINKFWISPALGVLEHGPWWEALFNLLALTLLVSSLVYFLPYQVCLLFLPSSLRRRIKSEVLSCSLSGGLHVFHL